MNDINTLNHKMSKEVQNLVTVVDGCCLLDGYEHFGKTLLSAKKLVSTR